MKTYLTYAPIALLLVWLYLAFHWYKDLRTFQKETGINPFVPFQAFKFLLNSDNNGMENEALDKLKRQSRKYLKIWGISILVFILATFIAGIASARPV